MSELIAVGPEPWLRAHAERHAAESPLLVRVIDAVAEALPMPDASVDAVVVAG